MSRIIPIFKNQEEYYHFFFNDDGTEKLDLTPVEVPVEGFSNTSDTDDKLRLMLDRMIEAKMGKPDLETKEDDLDFDLPSDLPENKFTNFMTKEQARELKEQHKKKAADKERSDRKAAQTARAKPVDDDDVVHQKHNDKKTKSASEAPLEEADEE